MMTSYVPNDLDRLRSAWYALQTMVNTTLPAFAARARAAQAKVTTTTLPPGPRPS